MRAFNTQMGRRDSDTGYVDYAGEYRRRHAAYLRGLREALELRQEDVADALEVHHTMVSQWETGRSFIPPDRYAELADVLKVDRAETTKQSTNA